MGQEARATWWLGAHGASVPSLLGSVLDQLPNRLGRFGGKAGGPSPLLRWPRARHRPLQRQRPPAGLAAGASPPPPLAPAPQCWGFLSGWKGEEAAQGPEQPPRPPAVLAFVGPRPSPSRPRPSRAPPLASPAPCRPLPGPTRVCSWGRAVLFLIWRLSHLKYFGISSNIFCFRKVVKIN